MYIIDKDGFSSANPAMNISWYEAKQACISYNSSLLTFTSPNDVLNIQAFLIEIFDDTLPMPIFIGLKRDSEVSDKCNYFSLICSFIKCHKILSNNSVSITP